MSDIPSRTPTSFKSKLKRLLPGFVETFFRRSFSAFGTPLSLSFKMGHLRSSLLGKAVDRQGRAVPWFTYPAIDFLRAKDLSARSVLEFGSGHSTIWWGGHAREVVAFEFNEGWYRHVSSLVSSRVTLHYVPTVPEALPHVKDRRFDIIVIDGYDRVEVARAAIDYLAADGAIILDDAESDYAPAIHRHFRENGFQRVDFYGYGPALIQRRCTSLFFRGECCLLRGEEIAAVPA